MADELAALTAAHLEIEFDGKHYRFSPLGIKQTAQLRLWAKDRPFEDYARQARALKGQISEEERAALFKEARAQSTDEEAIKARLNSVEGTAKAFEMMLRINHPELTDEELGRLLSPDVEVRVWRWLGEVTAPVAKEEERKNAGGGDGKK